MKDSKQDWDPKSKEIIRDQRAAYDDLRRRCPVAHSPFLGWSLFRHEDVSRALHDHETFSNAVSRHLSVPNGMDPPEHTPYRKIIEPYFSPERMTEFEPTCREAMSKIAVEFETLIDQLIEDRLSESRGAKTDVISGLISEADTQFGKYKSAIKHICKHYVPLENLIQEIRPLLETFVSERRTAETFSDYWHRTNTSETPKNNTARFHTESSPPVRATC